MIGTDERRELVDELAYATMMLEHFTREKEEKESKIKTLAEFARRDKANVKIHQERIADISNILKADTAAKVYQEFRLSEGIESLRGRVVWGSYGKTGREKLKWILVKDLETDHIIAILKTQDQIELKMSRLLGMELAYRMEQRTGISFDLETIASDSWWLSGRK